MGLTILNRLGVIETKPDQKAGQRPPVDTPGEPSVEPPIIGMDGTTEDGSVPYLILQKQLECLR
jgi:hypothetical protein